MKSSNALPIRLLTHNIRYATNSPFKGEEMWSIRRPRLINELRFNTAHCTSSFICLQEVLHEQLLDILAGLNSDKKAWAYIGVGRDDGFQAGEYSPILYQPAIWMLQSCKTVWLSKTPDRPSKNWDAASKRILTIGVFRHRESRKKLIAMNTHLDDQGSQSRLEAAKIILTQVSQYTTEVEGVPPWPVFLAGDFNSEPDQEAYKAMISDQSPMCDLQSLISENQRYGDSNTFTGFGHESSPPKRIDFLFLSRQHHHQSPTNNSSNDKDNEWISQEYGVLPNRFEDGVYCSDHRAVVGDLLLS